MFGNKRIESLCDVLLERLNIIHNRVGFNSENSLFEEVQRLHNKLDMMNLRLSHVESAIYNSEENEQAKKACEGLRQLKELNKSVCASLDTVQRNKKPVGRPKKPQGIKSQKAD